MIALIFNFQASNISSIVVSAQTMDSTIIKMAHKTCGLVMYEPSPAPGSPSWPWAFSCISDTDGTVSPADSPFGDRYVVSLGYLVIMAVTIPLGLINLDENMIVQEGGFVLLCLCVVAWGIQFMYGGLQPSRMPAVVSSGFGPVLSTVVFNFGFITTVPSWLNEKAPGVGVATSTWVSIALSTAMFMVLGLLGGLGMDYPNGEDLLAAINDPSQPRILLISQIATYIFPIAALVSGIPVFAIIIRYNLVREGVPKLLANLFAVILPWAVAVFFYAGNLLTQIITWCVPGRRGVPSRSWLWLRMHTPSPHPPTPHPGRLR